MKRIIPVLLLLLVLLGLAVASTAGARTRRPTKVEVRHTSIGTILTTARGFTLYVFAADGRNRDKCVKISGCTSAWPLLKTRGTPIAGRGVKKSLLGTINIGHGRAQVTYAGHPLYTYVGDSAPRETSYVGFKQFGAKWYAIDGAGKVVK